MSTLCTKLKIKENIDCRKHWKEKNVTTKLETNFWKKNYDKISKNKNVEEKFWQEKMQIKSYGRKLGTKLIHGTK